MTASSIYAKFPTLETVSLSELSDIRSIADKMVSMYVEHEPHSDFSIRVLLPRAEGHSAKAKRLGLSLQGEFVLGLRKKHLLPKVREVRYLHDETHYGWILGSPEVLQRLET